MYNFKKPLYFKRVINDGKPSTIKLHMHDYWESVKPTQASCILSYAFLEELIVFQLNTWTHNLGHANQWRIQKKIIGFNFNKLNKFAPVLYIPLLKFWNAVPTFITLDPSLTLTKDVHKNNISCKNNSVVHKNNGSYS